MNGLANRLFLSIYLSNHLGPIPFKYKEAVTMALTKATAHAAVSRLITNLINIKDTTGQFLLRLEDGRVIDTKSWAGWEWTHGIGLYGITIAVFLSLAYVFEKTGNQSYLPWLDSWAEWAMHELPRTPHGGMAHITYLSENHHHQQLWDDTLMMTVMPLAKIGKVLNRPEYIAEAKRQFLIHIKYLFDTKTGLFFHGWEFNANQATRH